MSMEIDFTKLEKHLKTLSYKDDFCNIHSKKILEAHTIDDIINFGFSGSASSMQIVDFGEFFMTDILGNDLTVVKLTKRKYKTPKGRLVNAKIERIIISDCETQFGSCINGYWAIPLSCLIIK